jgi:hypothetical protein
MGKVRICGRASEKETGMSKHDDVVWMIEMTLASLLTRALKLRAVEDRWERHKGLVALAREIAVLAAEVERELERGEGEV